MPRDHEVFNTAVAAVRIKVEHTIGRLKGRFQSLKALRILISTAKDHARAVLWIRACCVLHNILLEDFYDDAWNLVEDRDIAEIENIMERHLLGPDGGRDAEAKRERLKVIIRGAAAIQEIRQE